MKKTVLIIVSILIVIIISILGYKLYIKHLIAKDEISYAKFLETAKFNKNFEKYDRLDVEYNTDDVNTLIDEVYNSNINKSNADYQYVTIPDVSLQFKDKIYEMKSTYDVKQLKEIIEKEDKKIYSFYMYYDKKIFDIIIVINFCITYNTGVLYFCIYYLCAKGRDTHGKQHRRKPY